jgi:chemotaxis signal transduction protein
MSSWTDPTKHPQFLFRIGDTWSVIPAELIETIIEDQQPTPLPMVPNHIQGMVPYGQKALPVLNRQAFLNLRYTGGDPAVPRLLVIKHDGMQVGVRVDQSAGIVHLSADELRSLDGLAGTTLARWATAMVETPKGIAVALNVDTLLDAARV